MAFTHRFAVMSLMGLSICVDRIDAFLPVNHVSSAYRTVASGALDKRRARKASLVGNAVRARDLMGDFGRKECWIEGLEAIDRHNEELLDTLDELRQQPFFRFYSVDLLKSCNYFPQEIDECATQSCEIYPVDDPEDVPSSIMEVDSNEHDFELDGWVRWDMPSEDYYDVFENREAYTAYDGSKIWTFIHNTICFRDPGVVSAAVDGDAWIPKEKWKRDFNRVVSGLHSSISAHIVQGILDTAGGDFADPIDGPVRGYDAEEGPPPQEEGGGEAGEEALAAAPRMVTAEGEYVKRLTSAGRNPEAVENLYFGYMLLLCAVREATGRLRATDLGTDVEGRPDDGSVACETRTLLEEVLTSPLVLDDGVGVANQNLRRHAVEAGGTLLWQARLRTRDLLRIMDCVQCNVCRLHGKVGALGIATAMQVLLGAEGRGGDSSRLHRVEIAALITTLGKFASAIQIVSEFEERRSSMGEE